MVMVCNYFYQCVNQFLSLTASLAAKEVKNNLQVEANKENLAEIQKIINGALAQSPLFNLADISAGIAFVDDCAGGQIQIPACSFLHIRLMIFTNWPELKFQVVKTGNLIIANEIIMNLHFNRNSE
jgi:5-carboxymethyl-2-hydroxymuconate isomerase